MTSKQITAAGAVANTAMEGSGFYNRNSNLQAAGIELALPLFEEAAGTLVIENNVETPLVIADYGSSQGRNSMRPMRLAIETLRKRIGPHRPIEVVHTDLPSNDFTSLFMSLQDDGVSYLAGQSHVFPSAVGRSYFAPILPAGRVHLGWNTWTLHWLSRNPAEVPDHCVAIMSASESAREAVRHQQALDWAAFLAARSCEMADGAKLVSLSIGRTPEVHGWDWLFGELWQALLEMADQGLLSQVELMRYTAPVAGRWTDDLKAPFADGPFYGLTLEHADVLEAPDPFWDEFIETKDAARLGKRWAGMMRAVSGPVAAAAFALRENKETLVDELFQRLEARIATAPQKHQHFVAVAVVRKTCV